MSKEEWIFVGIMLLVCASLLVSVFFPQKHICVDRVNHEPIHATNLQDMFNKCLTQCQDAIYKADCINACTDMVENIYIKGETNENRS
jgi:hypothetical protein